MVHEADERDGATSERPPEERPVAPPDEEPVTAHPDPAEPAGEDDPANEAEIEEATERADGMEGGEPSEEEASAPAELTELRAERDRYLELAQRAQADFENYRKRAAKEAAAAGDKAKGGLVRELLPVVDNLERALASAGDAEQHLAAGVGMVHSELVGVLERNGVEQFDPRGEPFDPSFHEALSTREQDGTDAGVVLDVIEKGYRLNGSVLRPARVVVSG